MKTESEFITRFFFRLAYYRTKFKSRLRAIKKAVKGALKIKAVFNLAIVGK